MLSLFTVAVVSVFFGLFDQFFNPAWMSCYVIGFYLGVNERKEYITINKLMLFFGVLAIIGNGIQIYCDYVKKLSFPGKVELVYNYFRNYNHVWLGVFLFLSLKNTFERVVYSSKMKRFLSITDKYSYETYLVHQFLILGPFSLMELTPILPLNIVIILIGIGVLEYSVFREHQNRRD